MPEVVYPKKGADGKPRYWNEVFPIWENDDEHKDYQFIDSILEAIAMNNRFVGKSLPALKRDLKSRYAKYLRETLEKMGDGGVHKHREEFPDSEHRDYGCECPVPEDRKKFIERRDALFESYGRALFYIDRIFEELGGAYREFKSRPPVEDGVN